MFYGWYIVGACCLISFYFSGCIFLGFTAAFEPIANEFGWSYTEVSFLSKAYFGRRNLATIVGFVSGVMMVGGVVGTTLTGWVFDNMGRYQPAWFLLAGESGLATILFFVYFKNRSS